MVCSLDRRPPFYYLLGLWDWKVTKDSACYRGSLSDRLAQWLSTEGARRVRNRALGEADAHSPAAPFENRAASGVLEILRVF